ncbi:hypothetical protein FH968_00605 [Buttiauxella sp. B2]|uniref:hypothetical protein n=1 Tax=Buttiauxella sp. B2 TaxID=2587812 RepID=UPI001122848B|nr:hypothetical protein [Buttiauxella sp. B2]TNV22592.1 hypothetical protein FH968_00605 [Buttiauxella sp. B2]
MNKLLEVISQSNFGLRNHTKLQLGKMKRINIRVLFIFSVMLPGSAFAFGAPMLGGIAAKAHQVCGKNIQLQMTTTKEGLAIIGLINKKTNQMDLFQSEVALTNEHQITKYSPVKYDAISKEYIPIDNELISIIWGSVSDDKKATHYTMSLGSHVYECSLLQEWPSELADNLYGDNEEPSTVDNH